MYVCVLCVCESVSVCVCLCVCVFVCVCTCHKEMWVVVVRTQSRVSTTVAKSQHSTDQ